MTYEKLVAKIQKAYAKTDASKVNEHVAVQVNVTGEAEGAFYIEIAGGAVNVQPYDYVDHDMVITADEKIISDIAAGKVTVENAVNASKISVSGPEINKAIALLDTVEFAKAEKKPAAKKATTAKKTTAAKKTTTKKAEEVKTEAKKEVASKVEAPKAEVKAAEKKPAAKKATTAKKATATKKTTK